MKKRIIKSFLSLILCFSLSSGMIFDVYAGEDELFTDEGAVETAEQENDTEGSVSGEKDDESLQGSEDADPGNEPYPEESSDTAEWDTSVSGYFELPGKESVSYVDDDIAYDRIESDLVEGTDDYEIYSTGYEEKVEIGTAFPYPYTASGNIAEYFSSRYPKNRNQNPYGSCWAHSAMALFEFYMINHNMTDAPLDMDLSELHTVYYTYNQGSPSIAGDTKDTVTFNGTGGILNAGGNLEFATQTFMCYRGVVSENEMPYSEAYKVNNNTYTPEDIEFSSVVRLKNAKEINIKNTDLIKQCIMENGAVGVSIYSSDSFYDQVHNSYYCATQTKTNHAVCLVGWDDDFPAEHFKKSAGKLPEADGAWLVRNSWNYEGTELLSNYNYFWISYEDSGLSKPSKSSGDKETEKSAWTFDVADTSELPENNYFYSSQIHSKSYMNTSYCANVYTANSGSPREVIKAVSFDVLGLDKSGTEYEVCIYKNVDPLKGPESGKKIEASVTKGVVYLDGKYTINLKNSVRVKNGESFAVVFKRSDDKTVCYERAYSRDNGIVYTVGCEYGQSFFSKDGTNWTDVVGSSATNNRSNFILHVYTDNDPTPVPIGDGSAFNVYPDMEDEEIFLVKGQSFIPASNDSWESSDPKMIKIGKDGSISAKKPGKCVLSNGDGKSVVAYVVKPEVIKKSIEVLPGDKIDLKSNLKFMLDDTDMSKDYRTSFYCSSPSVLSIEKSDAAAHTPGKTIVYCVINSRIYKFSVKVSEKNKITLESKDAAFSLQPMQSIKLKLKGYSFKNITYSSDMGMNTLAGGKGYADNVVCISPEGMLTAIGCGTSRISCSNGVTLSVTVREPAERLYYLNKSDHKKISVSGIKNSDLKMSVVSGNKVISLDEKGRIDALSAGVADISLHCNPYSVDGAGFDFRIKVYVEDPNIRVQKGLRFEKARKYTLDIKEGEIFELSFVNNDSYAVYQPVSYKTSKAAAAFADENGKVYAMRPGKCVLNTKINGKTYTINVRVSAGDQGGA